MNIELLPGLTNVIRFPTEERTQPSVLLLHEIEPDVREVLNIVEAFGFEGYDADLANATDRETARHIAEQILPVAGPGLNKALDDLLAPSVETAVAACRAAHASSLRSTLAQTKLHAAQVDGSAWLEPLEERAEAATLETVGLLIVASSRCQEVRGINRAIRLARKGEPWTPYDPQADALHWLDEVARQKGIALA